MWEWTSEVLNEYRMFRGSSYKEHGSNTPITSRNSNAEQGANATYNDVGFRVVLYIK